jgi:hypothetical protein
MNLTDSLVAKAKKTDSRVWKWILGVVIAVLVAFVVWYIKRQSDKVAFLKAQKALADERAKDMEVGAQNETDENLARELKEEAERLRAEAARIDTELIHARKETEEAKKRVDNVKDWKKLEDEARGK